MAEVRVEQFTRSDGATVVNVLRATTVNGLTVWVRADNGPLVIPADD